ncbi:MAG: HlyD family efflux transporter periplasmic adaptor subunit, partial [Woeseiaceae bacterium]|nr:HlyD family efflux transporter periplasmic adaptor subunit [Woeseiaceae bacterium]
MTPETRQTFARAGVALGLIVASIAVTALLVSTKPPPERREVAALDPLVEVIPVRSETVAFTVTSQGTVRPRIETILSAEVAGAIVSVSPAFVAGGVFERGGELLRIDPTNYEVAVEQGEALVAQRRIEYQGAQRLREQGYRAEAEYASAKAALASANAELVRARRNLERTRVTLPYAGIVRSRDADLGQYVNVGSRLGVTFSTETAEVRLPLTDQDLAFLDMPDPVAINTPGGAVGPEVTLRADVRGEKRSWQARIVRTEGVVDETTRVTYVVAAVNDPYGRDAGSGT